MQSADLKEAKPTLQSAIANLPSEIRDVLEIAVTDTGIGIKPEDLPRLFQPFSQLEPAYAKRHQGTGLGLALTRRLVELHGGMIRAESEGEGSGTTFTVRLPLIPPPPERAARIDGLDPARQRAFLGSIRIVSAHA